MNRQEYNKRYYEKKKNDPEFMEKKRAKSREYWATLKEQNPEKYAEYKEKQRKRAKEMRDLYNKSKNNLSTDN